MTASAASLDFEKYTALGNDYLLVAEEDLPGPLTPSAVVGLCDRRLGVGADGVLVGGRPAADGPFPVRMINSDGSECARSINGLRLFARWLRDTGAVRTDSFVVTCAGGPAHVELHGDGSVSVRTAAGDFDAAAAGWEEAAADCRRLTLSTSAGPLDVAALGNGTPHVVVFTPLPAAVRERLGPEIAGHPALRGRTNVVFVTAVEDAVLDIEVFERGAGRTPASGAAAGAAVAAAEARGLVGRETTVRMPGGEMTAVLDGGGMLWLGGPVSRVFGGRVALPALPDGGGAR